MTNLLVASNVGLWIFVVLLIVGICALSRQVGLLHARLPPTGARVMHDGPEIGKAAPEIDELDIDGRQARIMPGVTTLIVFMSPTCPACRDLMPGIRTLARSERELAVILISLGSSVEIVREYALANHLAGIPIVTSTAMSEKFRVAGPPYAVAIGKDGLVKGKGVINTWEHVESLINAAEMGHPSIQSFIKAQVDAERAGLQSVS